MYGYACATLFAAPNSLVLVRVQHSTSSFDPESLLPGPGAVDCFDDVCLPETDTDTAEVDAVVAPLEAADAYENVPAVRVCSFVPLTGPKEAGGNESDARASGLTMVEEVEFEVAVLIEGFGCIFLVLLPIQESVLQLET